MALFCQPSQSRPNAVTLPHSFRFSEALLDEVAAALRQRDWLVLDGCLDEALLTALADRATSTPLSPAAMGRGGERRHSASRRGDGIAWLDASQSPDSQLIAAMENLLQGVNQRLFLGLFSVEAHYAHYPPGAAYEKHRDAFRSSSSRVLSLVLYLNRDWRREEGGQLRLYTTDGAAISEEIVPRWGRLVIFLSEAVPHEVLSASRDRYSIAAWFSINRSDGRRLDPPT